MKFIEINAPFISDGIWTGNEFDPNDRGNAIYAGLDDAGFGMKSEFVRAKMEDARNGDAGWYDATTYFLPGDIRAFRVLDDEGNPVGYCAYNDWNSELQTSEGVDAKTQNRSFAYCDEVEGMDDGEILMFLANRMLNALARLDGDDDAEVVVPFGSRVASCGASFPKCACNQKTTDFDRGVLSMGRG